MPSSGGGSGSAEVKIAATLDNTMLKSHRFDETVLLSKYSLDLMSRLLLWECLFPRVGVGWRVFPSQLNRILVSISLLVTRSKEINKENASNPMLQQTFVIHELLNCRICQKVHVEQFVANFLISYNTKTAESVKVVSCQKPPDVNLNLFRQTFGKPNPFRTWHECAKSLVQETVTRQPWCLESGVRHGKLTAYACQKCSTFPRNILCRVDIRYNKLQIVLFFLWVYIISNLK